MVGPRNRSEDGTRSGSQDGAIIILMRVKCDICDIGQSACHVLKNTNNPKGGGNKDLVESYL